MIRLQDGPRRKRTARFLAAAAWVAVSSGGGGVPLRGETAETIVVDLKLRSGGALSGAVVAHNDDGLVIVSDGTPYVFAFTELTSGSAYVTRRDLLAFARGGEGKLTPADHYDLGLFALDLDRNDLAAREFREATQRDSRYQSRVRQAFDEYRTRSEAVETQIAELETPVVDENRSEESRPQQGGSSTTDVLTAALSRGNAQRAEQRRQHIDKIYRTFGAKVQEVISEDIVLIETDHFLIWTDWEPKHRDRLPSLCEGMFDALSRQFGVDPDKPLFLAKCPMFCFRIKPRFQKFAQYFDGYSGENAIGYTRSIEANGHVHVALLRQGRSRLDFDQFACTLVHEGTHAFVHRLEGPRLIPHWVNEGLAEMTAERVLSDRCPSAENAELLARCYVRYDWPVGGLLETVEPIGVHQYPLAHSVVMYLEARGRGRFRDFVQSLTRGRPLPDALAAHYDGLSLEQLEEKWRDWIRERMSEEADVRRGAVADSPKSDDGP